MSIVSYKRNMTISKNDNEQKIEAILAEKREQIIKTSFSSPEMTNFVNKRHKTK